MDEPKYRDLVKAIAQAAWDSREHLRYHLMRDDSGVSDEIAKKNEKNRDHIHIENFQKEVCKRLNENELLFGPQNSDSKKRVWQPEIEKQDTKEGDRVDIMKVKGRKCIIEIDTARHDQIAPKFVSRLALWGLEEPIDYVILLYDSTEKSGKHSAEKFVRYTYSILKAINEKSTLIGIYVHTPKSPNDNDKDSLEYWDYEDQGFQIKIKDVTPTQYQNMNECARAAIKLYIEKHPKITFDKLRKKFTMSERTSSSYISDKPGKSRAKSIGKQIKDKDIDIHVYSQFRNDGYQRNWNRFVEICKKNKIIIEQSFLQSKYAPPFN